MITANRSASCGKLLASLGLFLAACGSTADRASPESPSSSAPQGPYVVVLGIAQDGGAPQTGCSKACCAERWRDPSQRCHVACLAIVDPSTKRRWLIDATPDFREQLRALDELAPRDDRPGLDGILLTHAHAGHYLGLAQLGREVLGARGVPVYAMPRMREFLEQNGPWSQLVQLGNIELCSLAADRPVELAEGIAVVPVPVPHRDEFSETVAYLIRGPHRSVLWLPDIDKWERWERPLEELLATVDLAFVDGTFYDGEELPGRNMSEIPHPFIVETMQRLERLPPEMRAKVRFVHLNHTNPLFVEDSQASRMVNGAGLSVAREGELVEL